MSKENNLLKAMKSLLNTKTHDVSPKKYSLGGSILSSLTSLIPGVGAIVSPMVNVIDQERDKKLLMDEAMNKPQPLKMNTNIYGNQMYGGPITPQSQVKSETTAINIPTIPVLNPELMKLSKINTFDKTEVNAGNSAIDMYNVETAALLKGGERHNTKSMSNVPRFRERALGGETTSNFKQYNTGSHDSGNDQNIAENGIPNNINSTATVQNKENAYTQKGKTYIYSDVLLNPETGNNFNIDAAKLNTKYKKADTSLEDRNALDFTMDRLSKVNDMMRNAKEMVDKACGGSTKKANGGPTEPLQFAGRSQNPDYLEKIKSNYSGGYPQYGVNTDNFKEMKKFDNGDTLVNWKEIYTNSKNKVDLAEMYAIRDSKSGKYHTISNPTHAQELMKYYEGGPVVPASDNLSWMAQTNISQPQLFTPPVLPDMAPSFEEMNGNAARLTPKMEPLQTLPLPGLNKPETNYMPSKVEEPKLKNRTTEGGLKLNKFDYNIPAGLLKGIALGKSVVDAITPAEKENTILPDYRKSDSQMYGMNVDYTQARQDAMAAANLAGNVNRSASSNLGQFQGRQANNYANLADQTGRISMQENLARNQQFTQRAGYEQGKAVDTANRETQNRINNQQNQANADFADQKLFSEIADIGTQFNKYEYYKDMVTNKKEIAQATINEGLALVGSKYSNFGFDADFMEKIKSGSASVDELVKFISTVDQVKSKKDKQ